MSETEYTGMLLKLERIAAEVDQSEVARELGLTQGRIAQVESAERLSENDFVRYRSALRAVVTRKRAGEEK